MSRYGVFSLNFLFFFFFGKAFQSSKSVFSGKTVFFHYSYNCSIPLSFSTVSIFYSSLGVLCSLTPLYLSSMSLRFF